ncbi:zinc finger protein 276 [Brienomyrus brachyistius]|uniref:zinc finger protein 276 n=1 Tax=Brienomyrus brachyistius TaxID=42636 RepID=UPI0020B3FF9C|nr:zinc finger protein 276 [Brienomyrus brachyistius]
MKRDRRGRLAARSPPTSHAQAVGAGRRPGRRGRPRATVEKGASGEGLEASRRSGGPVETAEGGRVKAIAVPALAAGAGDRTENGSHHISSGRLSTEFCRLCHGKFSPRSLRYAFGQPQGPPVEEKREKSALFCADFQHLVGVPVSRDPLLSQFVCKSCHAQFYKCHNILLAFLRRVNLSPSSCDSTGDWGNSMCSKLVDDALLSASPITSSPQCLHKLVSWAHQHAEGCRSCPSLQEVLQGQYQGMVRAVWGCVEGHSYAVEAYMYPGSSPRKAATSLRPEREEETWRKGALKPGVGLTAAGPPEGMPIAPPSPAAAPQGPGLKPMLSIDTIDTTEGLVQSEEMATPIAAEPLDIAGDSDLSDRDFSSEDEERRKSGSSDELFEPYPGKRGVVSSKKTPTREPKMPLEPKARKKPGPKPGWKKMIKTEREELPTIYKCPHQGCTAVYRGADGMKKHIKEHHEEVRERPCPHPGCNKVFMIDRYLQRHVKLIHTEVRNYICDQCGQTFKQRKHLSVHQMRHSGAKPLQCEVCGFQCRQRASLKYHMTKHKAEEELEFACELCGKRFEKAHNLNVHMSMVHPLKHSSGPEPPAAPVPLPRCKDAATPL